MFFFELHVSPPLFKTLVNLVLSKLKHCLGVITADFLKAPSRFVSEVKIESVLWSWAAAHVVRTEVVLVCDVRMGSLLLLDGGWSKVVFPDVPSVLVVCESIFVDGLFMRVVIPADDDIDDDIRGVIDYIEALVDSGVDVDVPESASISEDVTVPVLWWKGSGDGS